MTSLIGYARVSRRSQNPEAQEAARRGAGAGKFFMDHGKSSRLTNRPQCLEYMREGDTFPVHRAARHRACRPGQDLRLIRGADARLR